MKIPTQQQLGSALRTHWPEYVMEACELALFMISACLFATLLFHPAVGAERAIPSEFVRRALMGLAMGLTAVAIINSPLGQRSGAHMNPAVTLTFWRLGRVDTPDAVFYVIAQFLGGIAGVLFAKAILGELVAHLSVNHVVTLPGESGLAWAWSGEFVIAGILMTTVLTVSNVRGLNKYTGLLAGVLVMTFITFENPLSGMSMNPARSFGSAYWANVWTGLWIYFTAPPLAMLISAAFYRRVAGAHRVYCAKLHHQNPHRCIFRCDFGRLEAGDLKPSANATNPSQSMAAIPACSEVLHFG